MSVVNIAELKNRLSHYLRLVSEGEVVWVRNRDRVVARLDAARGSDALVGDEGARLEDLALRGVVRRASRPLTAEWLAERPKGCADVVSALLDEREGGR